MTLEELKIKASSLPLEPGVYIMRDQDNHVIYVGKAKKLKNRVSQYFLDSVSHSPKTKLMVSKIYDFEVIIATSEFEALVLECAQIKRYMPKYNILLKDDKGYPYIRLDMKEEYPCLTMVSRPSDDGATYYGPYGSRGITQDLIHTILHIFKLPSCGKKFPRDLQKGRTCLNYHMNFCAGWCQKSNNAQLYRNTVEKVVQVLQGNYKNVTDNLMVEMGRASEALEFELAASIRDQIQAIQALNKKQFVTAGSLSEVDAIGYGETETKACFAVLHFRKGELIDKEFEILSAGDRENAVSSLTVQYYLNRGFAPQNILLPFAFEDRTLVADLLHQQYQKKVSLRVPQRGESVRLVELACKNALEEAERITTKEERHSATMILLAKMLGVEHIHRVESYDVSNISGSDNVASMVVFMEGKPQKSQYKRFKIDLNGQQNDYDSMRQVIARRFINFLEGENGFADKPDVLLIDGGITHASAVLEVLNFLEIHIPVFGMVKDDRHRTRALVTPDGCEIRIDNQPSIFSLIGTIQEETHRFAIAYHRKLRSRRLKASELDNIPGIGPKRKQDLLKHFSSVAAIKTASVVELEHYLPKNTALAVYSYFHPKKG